MANLNRYTLTFFASLFVLHCLAQSDPLAEIQGRLSIYHPGDTSSTHIGLLAGKKQVLDGRRFNTFIGSEAGANNVDGSYNTFVGSLSGLDTDTAQLNTFVGAGAGAYHKGSWNTIMGGLQLGVEEGRGNTIMGAHRNFFEGIGGSYNCFFGMDAGFFCKTGMHNVAIGIQAMRTNRENSYNVAIGDSSLYHIEDDGEIFDQSFENTALGASSLLNSRRTPVKQSVALGFQAGYDGGDNSVFIGYQAGKDNSATRGDRLWISNRAGDDPLIYGEFNNEKLGINTSSPDATLHIGGTGNESQILLANAGDILFKKSDGITNKPILSLHSDDDTYLDAVDDLKFRSGDNGNVDLIIQADGDVGIGLSNPSVKLDVLGTIRGTSVFCGGINACSDIRFKKDFSPIQNPLNILSKLTGYFHFWRSAEFPTWQFTKEREIGFKAQDVKKVLPEIVEEMPDGYLAVDYSKLVPVLVEAIKELTEEVNQLSAEVHRLQGHTKN